MHNHTSPPVAAVFLVLFDQKVGYTIAWKRSLAEIDLDGVEYKSLPSGLHTVKEELVYFLHGKHAGVSIFVQETADAQHRNASFAAVGALVPLRYGQLGRSWTHAAELRSLARDVVKETSDMKPLELFWNKHRADSSSRDGSVSPIVKRGGDVPVLNNKHKKRALSDVTLAGFDVDHTLPADHPALHVPALLDAFGPLLFPLQRAALSRKRVLLLGSPAVQANANTVYLTSVLSSIPPSLRDGLPAETESYLRASPLFSVGIHDIPDLLSRKSDKAGWLACTTDDILGEKKDLYDILVQMPSIELQSRNAWPKIKTSDGRAIKASQRDLRIWALLKRELRRLRQQTVRTYADQVSSDDRDNGDERPLLEESSAISGSHRDTFLQDRNESEVAEPASWISLAHKGFMWWASAGEVNAWENDDAKADEELLSDMPDACNLTLASEANGRTQEDLDVQYSRAAATYVVAYFGRAMERILRSLTRIIEKADDESEEGVQTEDISIPAEELRAMGLDSWNDADKVFVQDMLKVWFDRSAYITDEGLRVCGVKIC